jgi:methionine synthase II (cobalamin-independent)
MSTRFHIVGSLLRPATLLKYKRQIEQRGDITYPFYSDLEGYQACETEATRDVVAKQIQHKVAIITDGEFTRSIWYCDFVWGLQGAGRVILPQGLLFRDKDGKSDYETRKDLGFRISAKLSGKNHHFIKLYQQLQSFAAGHPIKLTIPSPAQIFALLQWSDNWGKPDSVYATVDELKAGFTNAYKEFLEDYAAVGGKIVQFDDCLWEFFSPDNPLSPVVGPNAKAEDLTAQALQFIELNNTVVAIGKGLGLTVWTHNCRGNYASRFAGAGSYDRIADLFLKLQRYDRFFLEWDDDRAGSLDALKVFANTKTEIVLGLLSSKKNTLDDEDRVLRLLNEASKIIPKERLHLSHQCGFASCDGGNELTEEEQWAKIDQGQKLALAFWGE